MDADEEGGRRRQPFYPNGRFDVLTTDVVGSGVRVDLGLKRHLREKHYEALVESLDRCGIPATDRYVEDRGDGALVIPKNSVTVVLVGDFIDRMNTALRRHNRVSNDEARLRLRIAVHVGHVEYDGYGLVGQDVDHTFRLLDSPAFKKLLTDSDATVGFIASGEVYKNCIQHVPDRVDPDDFSPIDLQNKETETQGWVRLRGKAVPGPEVPAPLPPVPEKQEEESLARQPEILRFTDVLDGSFIEGLRDRVGHYGQLVDDQSHCVQLFRQLARAYVDTGRLLTSDNQEQLAVALTMAELSVLRRDMGLHRLGFANTAVVAELLSDLTLITAGAGAQIKKERSSLRTIVSKVGLNSPVGLNGFRGAAKCPTAALYALFWGIAQLALLADHPQLFREDSGLYVNRHARDKTVLEVEVDPDGQRVFLSVAVTSRQAFEDLMEGWHVVSQYLAQVEDLWRLSGHISPPIRIFFRYPLWHDRSLRSHHFTVEPRSITGLLMGKALYGNRKHVWLRELMQNAIDATRTRQSLLRDADYEPEVTIEWIDSRNICVSDNGIGMTNPQIFSFLTTLGRSGWRSAEPDEEKSEMSFIGRFGIGFASVFGAAKSVEVRTRSWGQSGTDGWVVRFSDLDRPFFIEPAPCDTGTQVFLELNADLSKTDFESAMKDLFVYIPQFVTVLPVRSAPTSLDDVSVLEARNGPASSTTRVQRLDRIQIGTAPATIKTELYSRDKPKGKQQLREGPYIPRTSLTVAINGILVFTQNGLVVSSNRRAATGFRGPSDDLGLAGCHVTIDFDAQHAPVLPSRDALDPDAFSVSDVSSEILRQVSMLVPELAEAAVTRASERKHEKRGAVLAALESIVVPDTQYSRMDREGGEYHRSAVILESAAATYVRNCPIVIIDTVAEGTRYAMFGELDEGITTAVLSSVTNSSAFSLYTRSRGMTSWVELASRKELALLRQAWPQGRSLETIDSTDKLFEAYSSVFAEVRDRPVFGILRGDYALSDSSLFGSSLFFRIPSGATGITQPDGVSARRSSFALASAPTPRIVLNADHPLILGLDEILTQGAAAERDQAHTLFDYVCDSVIDDKRKRSPDTRWRELRTKLGGLTGTDLDDIAFRTLELSL